MHGGGGTNKKQKNDCFQEKIMHLNASSPEKLRPVKLWFPLVSVWVGLRLDKAQGSWDYWTCCWDAKGRLQGGKKGEGCPSNSYPMLPPQLHSTFPAPVSHAFPVSQEFLKERLNTSFPGLLRAPETRGEAKSLKSWALTNYMELT